MKNSFYMPLTAAPFKHSNRYREVLPENLELRRYIRCFWGSEKTYVQKGKEPVAGIIIPDTCVDIIYYIDHTENRVTGGFCGISDTSFVEEVSAKPGHLVSMFAIRFFAWGVYAFSEDSLKGSLNEYCDVESRFRRLDRILRPQLLEHCFIEERIHIAEEYFLGQMFRLRQNDIIDQAVREIVLHTGALDVSELAKECFVSSRQLERLFHEYIGITPKKLCNLVRYQCLWNEILRNPDFCILDAVERYRYTDQAHLTREFKRYHTMDIKKAKMYACQNVENIQYIHRDVQYNTGDILSDEREDRL